MITSVQCRMARAGLEWVLADLAREAGVSANTIHHFEHGRGVGAGTIKKLQRALEAAGVEFTNAGGLGVKLRNLSGAEEAEVTIPPKSIEVGKCYLASSCGGRPKIRRVIQVLPDGRVRYEQRTAKRDWKAGVQYQDVFVSMIEREVPCDWTPEGMDKSRPDMRPAA